MYEDGIFNHKTLIVLGTGIALGIIFKQQSEIHKLKFTLSYLQELTR